MLPYLPLALLTAVAVAFAYASTLPSADPFYTTPRNVGHYAPGQLIRRRHVRPELSGLAAEDVVQVAQFIQYLYRTTDSVGNPVAAVASLFVPENPDPMKLLVYETAYDSANNDCSPSYQLQDASGNSSSDALFIAAALNNGWYVVTADYEGLHAQYVAGVQSGLAVLDSVRVTLSEAHSVGLSPSARYVLTGYSGGALAAEWAAELQPSYAPELRFSGAAVGGTTPNLTNVLLTINGGPAAGIAFAGLFGLSKAYPKFAALLEEEFLPGKKSSFHSIANGCLSQSTAAGTNMDVFTCFKSGNQILHNPVWISTLAAGGQMGVHGVPKMPLFIYKAIGDELSPVADTDSLVNKLCSKGATIHYQKDLIGEHETESILGSSKAFAWIADRLAGIPILNHGKCVTTYVALTAIDLGTIPALGGQIMALLMSMI